MVSFVVRRHHPTSSVDRFCIVCEAVGGRWSLEVISIRTPSLGDSTYVLIADNHAVVVDPQRDIGRFLEIVEQHGVLVSHVLETHMHNDYVSGGRDLARKTGAELILSAATSAAFAFVPAFHREVLEGPDGIVIDPIHTPGHTPSHTSYFVRSDTSDPAVFTGGSLLVGSAGRSDLLGDEFARSLSKLQYGSLQRLATLPDHTGLFPTHGEGSFCSATAAGRTTSTIGAEKAENPLYQFHDADALQTTNWADWSHTRATTHTWPRSTGEDDPQSQTWNLPTSALTRWRPTSGIEDRSWTVEIARHTRPDTFLAPSESSAGCRLRRGQGGCSHSMLRS